MDEAKQENVYLANTSLVNMIEKYLNYLKCQNYYFKQISMHREQTKEMYSDMQHGRYNGLQIKWFLGNKVKAIIRTQKKFNI